MSLADLLSWRRTQVAFIASTQLRSTGSTVLRSHQLEELARESLAGASFRSRVRSDVDVRNSVLIVSKNFMLTERPEVVEDARHRGNIILIDPVDGLISDEFFLLADVIIACSRAQHQALQRRYGEKVHYVGHHADLRIRVSKIPDDRTRIAYFGEPNNTTFGRELAELVDFHHTDTSSALNSEWMDQLSRYNAHYLLRSRNPWDGFKPFTKGFVAAAVGAVVIADEADEEARWWLPANYPYWVDGSLDSIFRVIGRMQAEFGGQSWTAARSALSFVRQGSSASVVAGQLLEAICFAVQRHKTGTRGLTASNKMTQLADSPVSRSEEPGPTTEVPSPGASSPPHVIVRKSRRALYTCLFGYSEAFNDFEYDTGDIDLICFTDDPELRSEHWEIRLVSPGLLDPARQSKRIKHLPHIFLPEYDESLYLDNTVRLKSNPARLFDELLVPAAAPIVCFRHHGRDCIYEEAEAVIVAGYDDPEVVRRQMAHYRKLGHPPHYGLVKGAFLLRRNHDAQLQRFMWEWDCQVLRFSKRDQLSFMPVMRFMSAKVTIIDEDFTDNEWLEWPIPTSEGRLPRDFDDERYLTLHPMIQGNPRKHFLQVGRQNGWRYK